MPPFAGSWIRAPARRGRWMGTQLHSALHQESPSQMRHTRSVRCVRTSMLCIVLFHSLHCWIFCIQHVELLVCLAHELQSLQADPRSEATTVDQHRCSTCSCPPNPATDRLTVKGQTSSCQFHLHIVGADGRWAGGALTSTKRIYAKHGRQSLTHHTHPHPPPNVASFHRSCVQQRDENDGGVR